MDRNEITRENVKRFMAVKGVSLNALAEDMKKHPNQLRNVLNGTANIGPELLKEFADALGVKEDELHQRGPEPEKPIPHDIHIAMEAVKFILTTAKDSGDEWYERIVTGTLNTYREGVKRSVERRKLINEMEQLKKELKDLKRQLGIADPSGRSPAASPARRKAALK